MKPFFDPKNQPLKIAVLFSGNAGSAQSVQEKAAESPGLASKLKIVCALTDRKDAPGTPKLKGLGVPVIKADFREFCSQNSLGPRDLGGREKYFGLVLKELEKFSPDVLMLSGFMKIITEPLLSAYENRIINVHPADLTIMENGRPKFTGDNAVKDAIDAGEKFVRASVHLVSGDVDCGPILVLSKPVPVSGSADETQEKLKRGGDDPAFLKALELIAEGKVSIEKEKVFVEGKEGFFEL